MVSQRVMADFMSADPALKGHLKLADIDFAALQYLNQQWTPNPHPDRIVGLADDWRYMVQQYRRSYSSRIELAIWYDNHLCGLMLGKTSRSKLVLKINYLEGNHGVTFLKGLRLKIATRYAEIYAAALGIKWVGIQSPYVGAIRLYNNEGFVETDPFDRNNDALFKYIGL